MQKGILVPSGSERGPTEIQFDSELERGRSRDKRRDGTGRPMSLSRSRSRASSRVREEEFLKWTVLRKDPSMRLTSLNRKKKRKTGPEDEDDDEDDEDEDDEDEEEDEEESDEERVSDIENDVEIDEEFHFDLGTKVLPNFSSSINDVLENSKPWIQKYLDSINQEDEKKKVDFETLEGGYCRAIELVRKGKGAEGYDQSKNYILCTDLSSESTYALTYVMGSLVSNGDTLYIVHWDGNSTSFQRDTLADNILRVKKHVKHLMDCISVIVDDLDVVILSLTHPYPKHLLNEMIHGLKPVTLACSLSLILSSLQNFVCSVPTLVIRKKLKRSRKKGISE